MKGFQFKQFILILIAIKCVSICGVAYYTEKPDFVETCKAADPDFIKCSTRSIQKVMSYITNTGMPELMEVFGPLDPMKVDQITFNGDNNQAVTIKANLTNLLVKGMSGVVIKESRVSTKDFNWVTKVFIPKMRLEGKYKMVGRILLIPLNGNGNIFIEIDGLDLLMRTTVRLHEKGNFTFYDVKKMRVQLQPKKVRTHLDNIFNGASPEIERSTNQFFNENWPDFFEALRPLITETIENILFKILAKTFDLLPAKFFVSDIPTSEQLYNKKNKN